MKPWHKIIRNQKVISKQIHDEFIVLDPNNGKLYKLNETAELIWKATRSKTTLDEIVFKVTKKFNTDENSAKKETFQFVNKFINQLFFIVE